MSARLRWPAWQQYPAAMATTFFLFNAQTAQSTGYTGPSLATGVDDAEAAALVAAGYAQIATSWVVPE